MGIYRYVNPELPEAKRLADLSGIASDLECCRDYCDRFTDTFPSDRDLQCFAVFIAIKYARCFNQGARKGTSRELLSILKEDDRQIHDIIYALRDKHIGHSVSDWEAHFPRVWLTPEEEGRGIASVSIESQETLAPSPRLIGRLKEVVEKLLEWIKSEMRAEETKLFQVVTERFALDYLYSLDVQPIKEPGYDSLLSGKRRKGL
jgi:hypothetical protein